MRKTYKHCANFLNSRSRIRRPVHRPGSQTSPRVGFNIWAGAAEAEVHSHGPRAHGRARTNYRQTISGPRSARSSPPSASAACGSSCHLFLLPGKPLFWAVKGKGLHVHLSPCTPRVASSADAERAPVPGGPFAGLPPRVSGSCSVRLVAVSAGGDTDFQDGSALLIARAVRKQHQCGNTDSGR